jgi:hypothetical protein
VWHRAVTVAVVPDVEEQVREYAHKAVALAADPCGTIVSDVLEQLDGEAPPAGLAELAWRVVGAELADHLAAQAAWPETTDADRLTAAFRRLSAAGIVAREDFACCQSCGLAELGGEVVDGETPRGYAFYHHQDATDAATDGGLYIAFGRFEQPPTAEIGREVADALADQGLAVSWDGDPTTRIQLTLTWRRRRHGRLAALPTDTGSHTVEVVSVADWNNRYAPWPGVLPAAALAGLYLPWLPAKVRLEVIGAAGPVTIRRDGAALVGGYAGGSERTVGRFDGLALLGDPAARPPEAPAGQPGVLEVTREQPGDSEYQSVPLDRAECVDLLRRMPPRTGSWLGCVSASDRVVQMMWQQGRLWLESPDPSRRTTTGCHVELPDAERMITILADEDRVAVTDLPGTSTQPWD